MDISTDKWFRYLTEEVRLTEGLRDIGLPEFVVDYLEDAMPNASEKAKVYIANHWKQSLGGMAGAYTPDTLKYEIVSYLIDHSLRDYVQAPPSKESADDPVARTITPFSVGDADRKREMYDDERIKQNEQIKFVVVNLRNVVGRPMGTWRKAFMKAVKALSKADLPSEKVEEIKEFLRSFYSKNFHYWLNKYSELVAFLNDDATNYELIKGEEDINDAERIAIRYLENKEDPDHIIHQFDDGSYWYNLDVSSCDVEASRMGHCGSDSRGVLVSLRKKKDKRRESSSYVTMTWDRAESTIWQIKGRNNDAPPSETWHHIAWFINNMDIDAVHETGEHSNDYDGFIEMNEWLSQHTTAEFHGTRESREEAAREYCDNIDQRFYDNQDELGNASISWDILEDDWNNEIHVNMSAEYSFEINLGWTGIEETDDSLQAPNPQDFKGIPRHWGDISSWQTDMDMDDMMWAMPGDDGEVDTEVVMLEGPLTQDQMDDPNYEHKPTAHLKVRIYTTEVTTVDEDGEVPEYDSWADSMQEFADDEAPGLIEAIRQNLASAGYMARTPYDRKREQLEELGELDKWHVKRDKAGLELDWTAEDGQPLHYYPEPLPPEAQMYGMGTGNVMGRANADGIFREIFGYGKSYRFANLSGMVDVTISRVFAAKLSNLVNSSLMTKAKGQEEFDFGEKYKAVDPVKFLADDTDFVIFNKVRWNEADAMAGNTGAYPTISIAWLYRMRVGPQSSVDEFDIILDIAEYLNEKPELVTQAAEETLKFYLDAFMENINRRQEKVLDNQEIQRLINHAKEVYGGVMDAYANDPEHGSGTTAETARKLWHIVTWFEDKYNDMDEIERYIMLVHWLGPIAANRFHTYGANAQIDNDTGAPAQFAEKVAQQRKAMKRQTPKARNFQTPRGETLPGRVGEPRPAQESIEHQINRVDALLQELDPTYDLRVYQVIITCAVSKDIGGSESETAAEIRGIPGVTTVRPIADTKRAISALADAIQFDVKFALVGAQSRVKFRDEVLLPHLRRVEGLRLLNVSAIHRTNKKGTIRTVRESKVLREFYGGGDIGNFGGVAGALGSVGRRQSPAMPTPRPMIQTIIDDWADGGVMIYDHPTDTTDMAYHVMMPVEELIPFMGQYYRGDKKDFEGRYRHFIKDGATHPVYLAIGQNGRAKVTGGEDLIWFAKRAGLAELPVFFSYQKQV